MFSKEQLQVDRSVLQEFLTTWPKERVACMTLEDYSGYEDKTTFCQYVETRTRSLGSIKGLDSIMFGLYFRSPLSKQPKRHYFDDTHIWRKRLGEDKEEAFKTLKADILKVISYAENGALERVDDINLYQMYKWKIVFLYSKEAFIPIYKKALLEKIANSEGLQLAKNYKYSQIHRFLMQQKPFGMSVYDNM